MINHASPVCDERDDERATMYDVEDVVDK